ncbi:MAG: BamA/TamA family outer membrane protein, partial [Bacteriovoracaceae bacterium]
GTFQIGSVTPGATFDFRNNRINPTSGAWFNLSMEVANPSLLSQNNQELVINYYKFIARNRLYFPFEGGTVAMSLAVGTQENLAKKDGYIPNIKVFRLNGADAVRGFEDAEINRVPGGRDISSVEVNDKAYMAVLKVEPRIFMSDSTMFGVFYDAGRVFVNSYDPEQLRSSVGLTFKYLTPVGSLDFDYGIKLLRKRDDDGKVESPGRLHVSIGFF